MSSNVTNNKIFVSVDLDDWYFARWATGAKNSYWPSINACLKECYGSSEPPLKFEAATESVLELFQDLNFKSTFFITGYMANQYPRLVQKIAKNGHEIACHNYRHIDYESVVEKEFIQDITKAKLILEDLIDQEVIGYRSPNSSIPPYLPNALLSTGFKYDSSITPTRRIMGKFGHFTNAPKHPYNVNLNNIGKAGDSKLLEIPWPIFPIVKFPAGSGIMHRIAGSTYNNIAVKTSLKSGHTSYYFHPYEIAELPNLKIKKALKVKIFERNIGLNYKHSLSKFLKKHNSQLINGVGLYESIHTN